MAKAVAKATAKSTSRLVVDASIAIAWVHPGQATPQTTALLEQIGQGMQMVVPALWPLEVANALLTLERRKKLTADERETALKALQALGFTTDHDMSALAFSELSTLASTHALSVCDAAYLELAARLQVPLACKDGPLREAARQARVRVVP
jgi:predicted nucleic acid-binding protein